MAQVVEPERATNASSLHGWVPVAFAPRRGPDVGPLGRRLHQAHGSYRTVSPSREKGLRAIRGDLEEVPIAERANDESLADLPRPVFEVKLDSVQISALNEVAVGDDVS